MVKNEEKTLEQLKAEYEQAQKAFNDKKAEIEKQEAEATERKKAKLALEKNNRKEEIKKAKRYYLDLVKQYLDDYGSYEDSCQYEDGDDFLSFLFGSKPFTLFL